MKTIITIAHLEYYCEQQPKGNRYHITRIINSSDMSHVNIKPNIS